MIHIRHPECECGLFRAREPRRAPAQNSAAREGSRVVSGRILRGPRTAVQIAMAVVWWGASGWRWEGVYRYWQWRSIAQSDDQIDVRKMSISSSVVPAPQWPHTAMCVPDDQTRF